MQIVSFAVVTIEVGVEAATSLVRDEKFRWDDDRSVNGVDCRVMEKEMRHLGEGPVVQ